VGVVDRPGGVLGFRGMSSVSWLVGWAVVFRQAD
jgi:hypothetical protein